MTRKIVRIALLALIALAVAAALFNQFIKLEPAKTAQLSSVESASCATLKTAGISVIVEYPSVTKQFCVSYAKQSGWDLLNLIGADPTGTVEYPSGFVCKLFDFPTEQDCRDTPKPAEGTWNYFFATADQGAFWIYSGTGSSIRKPMCGDIEAWVFEEPTSVQSAEPPITKPEPFFCK